MKLTKILLAVTSLVLGASFASASSTAQFRIVENGVRQRAIEVRDVLGNTTRYTGFDALRPEQLRNVLRGNALTSTPDLQLFPGALNAVSPVKFRRHLLGMSPSLVPSNPSSSSYGTTLVYTIETDLGAKFFFGTNVFNIVPNDLDLTHGPNATAFHIHRGFPGGTGPILMDVNHLGDVVESATGFVSYAAGDVSSSQGAYTAPFTPSEILSFMETGEAYIAIHTLSHTTGELRGNF